MIRVVLSVLLIASTTAVGVDDEPQPIVVGPNLDQSPPGVSPELFAPGVISTPDDEAVFAVTGRFCYLSRSPSEFDGQWTEIPVLRSELGDGGWSMPEVVGEPGHPWYRAYGEAEAGERLLFAWTPHLDGSGGASNIDIWTVTMTASGWSEPRRLAAPVNLGGVDSWPSIADSGALYFFSNRPGGLGKGDLYRAVGVEFGTPVVEHLGDGLNSPFMEHDPCVAPDESFLIFASDRPGGFGGNDLYVTFPVSSGGWREPVNLGARINSRHEDARPVLSGDGKTLFFTRQSEAGMDVFQVSAAAITAEW